ncbi:hypothetical protein AB205_0071800 [Aquarana catesbeiana]|uniref:Uncharacterized protein n=1 Tax=Aquarana catesbeiana TaxID=8400 RepID=A0A2G9Q3V3_AQUCT|nr:hypothetical protein AB205_0071800 [Aquarana catesbeiana]
MLPNDTWANTTKRLIGNLFFSTWSCCLLKPYISICIMQETLQTVVLCVYLI